MMRAEDMKPGMWIRHPDAGPGQLVEPAFGAERARFLACGVLPVSPEFIEPWKPRVGEWVRCLDVGVSGYLGRVTSVYMHSVLVGREVASRIERCEPCLPPETATPKPTEAPPVFKVGDRVRLNAEGRAKWADFIEAKVPWALEAASGFAAGRTSGDYIDVRYTGGAYGSVLAKFLEHIPTEAPGTFPEGGPAIGDVARWVGPKEERAEGRVTKLDSCMGPNGWEWTVYILGAPRAGLYPPRHGHFRVEFISRPSEAAPVVNQEDREIESAYRRMRITGKLTADVPQPTGCIAGTSPAPERPGNGKCSCCGGPAYVGLNEVTCLAAKCEPPVTEPTLTQAILHDTDQCEYDENDRKLRGNEYGWRAYGRGKSAIHPTEAGAIAKWKALVGL